MEVLPKLFLLLLLLLLVVLFTSFTPVTGKGLYYSNRPGQPTNIHYLERKPSARGSSSSSSNCSGKCKTAEIIKVPLRTHSTDCPKNQKKDAKGRCRAYWS